MPGTKLNDDLCIATSNPTVWAVIASLTSALNAVVHTGPLFTHFVRSVSERTQSVSSLVEETEAEGRSRAEIREELEE